MYPVNGIKLNDCELNLFLGQVVMGKVGPHDQVVQVSSNLLHEPLSRFVIFPENNGAFQSSDYYQPEEICLQHFTDPINWTTLQYQILIEFMPGFTNPRKLEWRLEIITWMGKDGLLGKAISIICGSELAMTKLDQHLKENKDE